MMPEQFFKFFSALNSEWGLPCNDVTPVGYYSFIFTITVPTEGFNLVWPKFFSAKWNARSKKYYDLLSSKLPTNCSKSLASLKFL